MHCPLTVWTKRLLSASTRRSCFRLIVGIVRTSMLTVLKYQIVMAAHRPRCVHIYGPVRGGMGDKEMLERSGVLARLRPGKLIVADRGYIKKEFGGKISWPNPQEDSKEANNLKSRIRLRHESFNGKMAAFGCLNQTWRHSDDKHGIAFRAVAVTVQYALDNGTNLLFEP